MAVADADFETSAALVDEEGTVVAGAAAPVVAFEIVDAERTVVAGAAAPVVAFEIVDVDEATPGSGGPRRGWS